MASEEIIFQAAERRNKMNGTALIHLLWPTRINTAQTIPVTMYTVAEETTAQNNKWPHNSKK